MDFNSVLMSIIAVFFVLALIGLAVSVVWIVSIAKLYLGLGKRALASIERPKAAAISAANAGRGVATKTLARGQAVAGHAKQMYGEVRQTTVMVSEALHETGVQAENARRHVSTLAEDAVSSDATQFFSQVVELLRPQSRRN